MELKSKMSAIAKEFENDDPLLACTINYNLGTAHNELGREGGIEEATLYYQKSIELAKTAGNNYMLTRCVIRLSECYNFTS